MREVRTGFHSGEIALEGVLSIPEAMGPCPAVIVCHPHPLYGGSMDNNVVSCLCDALVRASFIAFKFNFRGVGKSQGEFSHGLGEQEDVGNAISFVTTLSEVDPERIGLAGYSAGAAFALPVGCRDARVKALAAVSPPLSMFDFEFLKECPKPRILFCGGKDDFTPIARFTEFCRNLPGPKEYDSIEGADHFWWGYEHELAERVAASFARALKR